jgi:hypothetical protein
VKHRTGDLARLCVGDGGVKLRLIRWTFAGKTHVGAHAPLYITEFSMLKQQHADSFLIRRPDCRGGALSRVQQDARTLQCPNHAGNKP